MKTWEKDAKKRLCSKASFSWLTHTYCGGVGGGGEIGGARVGVWDIPQGEKGALPIRGQGLTRHPRVCYHLGGCVRCLFSLLPSSDNELKAGHK